MQKKKRKKRRLNKKFFLVLIFLVLIVGCPLTLRCSTRTNNWLHQFKKENDEVQEKEQQKKDEDMQLFKSEFESDEHEHTWVEKTIHHEEKGHWENVEIQPAWDEDKWSERSICNNCEKDITGFEYEHGQAHALKGEKGGFHTEWRKDKKVIHHKAVYEKQYIVDQEAWDETYYVCSECGQRK